MSLMTTDCPVKKTTDFVEDPAPTLSPTCFDPTQLMPIPEQPEWKYAAIGSLVLSVIIITAMASVVWRNRVKFPSETTVD